MKPHPRNSHSSLRLTAGWCLLLLYVGALSPVGMVAGAILGSFDMDHRVLFQTGKSGLKLVLHHEGNCSQHEHHGVAQALTIFAQPTSTNNPDHVIQFASGDGQWSGTSRIVPGTAANEGSHFTHTALLFPQPYRIQSEFAPTGPPPDLLEHLLNVRFTVLLI